MMSAATPTLAPVQAMSDDSWLSTLIRSSGHEICLIDACSLAVLDASDAALRNLRYQRDALASISAPELLVGLGAERLHQLVGRLRAGDEPEIRLDVQLRRSDGSRDALIMRLSLLQLPALTALVAFGVRQQETPAGISREERFAQIESHVPGLLFQLRRSPSGLLQFSFLSQACQDLLGQPSEVMYANAARFVSQILDEDRAQWEEKLRSSERSLATFNWEGRLWIDAWQDFKWINVRATPRSEGRDGVLWTGLMTNITQSKQLQEEITRSRRQLAELSAHVESVKEAERERIERDLHDDLGGNLSALKMMLEHLWNQLPPSELLQERRGYLSELLDRSIESIHRIAVDLRPGILDAGLVAALEWLAQEHTRQTGVHCRLHCAAQDIAMDPKLATSLFRIAQEACNNVRKHAGASQVDIHLHDHGDELTLEIIDNGCGIPDERRDSPRSFGLRGMSERMAALGGDFLIASRAGKGTLVRVCLPLRDRRFESEA